MITRSSGSKIIDSYSSSDGHALNIGGGLCDVAASGQGSDCSHHQRRHRHNRRRLLLVLIVKIGLAISIGYQIIWAAKQLFNLTVVAVVTSDAEDFNDFPNYKLLSEQERSFANTQLQALVKNNQTIAIYSCPKGLQYVSDHIALPEESSINSNRRRLIPNILHFTTKSRCMTSAFAANIQLWKNRLGSQYSIYIHDDDTVDKFIYQREWREFPELKEVMACVTAGVRVMMMMMMISLTPICDSLLLIR